MNEQDIKKNGVILPQFAGDLTEDMLVQFVELAKQYIVVDNYFDISTINNIYVTGVRLLDSLEKIKNFPVKDGYVEEIAQLTQKAYRILRKDRKK